jgi:hypothetical protein
VVRKRPDSWLCCDPDDDEDDEWQYSIEAAEEQFCPFGGVGQYAPGCEDCDFCPIGELCEEITEKRFEAE